MVKALCQRILQGDAEASEALLRMFEPTLQRMATAFAKRYVHLPLEIDDYAQEGRIALLRAAQRAHEQQLQHFTAYANTAVRNAMLDAVRAAYPDGSAVSLDTLYCTANSHNHIIFCATSLDGRQKYRDVKRSAKELVQISDALCEENGLSVICNPQDKAVPYDKWAVNWKKSSHRDDLRIMIDAALRHRPDGFDALLQMLEDAGCRIRRGAHISLKPPDGQRYIRLKSLGPEYDEDTLRQALAGDHVHIPKTPCADYSKSQIKRLIDIEDKLRAGKGKGYLVWAERNNIDAISQTVIFLKEHHLGSPEELEQQIDDLQSAHDEKKASIRQAQNRMKEINRQRQAIRDYRRTKEIYTQFKESGWSAKFYQEHRAEIEAHKKAQAVYELHDGKLPTLKELTAEYVALKEQLDAYKPDLAELKSKLTDLKHIRYNYKILIRDIPQTDQYHRKGDRIER